MKTWICEICGDAYIGEHKPSSCPFCGSRQAFIKPGFEARPVTEVRKELGAQAKKNLEETLELEVDANAFYNCMAGNAHTYEIKKMYKRLAKVELEHATICTKILQIPMPETREKECSVEDIENFKKTLELEDHASNLYAQFAKSSEDAHVKIMFTALAQVESDHLELIQSYL